MRGKILVIDDDPDIVHLLEMHLTDEGYAVESALDGTGGLARAKEEKFDLIILDVMLPGLDGLEVCRRLRSDTPYTPVLMLTCKSSELDRVVGLELGADDYMSKPFSIRELKARVKALLRRIDALHPPAGRDGNHAVKAGDLVVDVEKRHVTRGGKAVNLTAKEFDLLLHFASNAGRVFTRSQLMDSVWGYGCEGQEHTVNTHINRLRAKIEDDPARPKLIRTVRGVGYRFAEGADRGDDD